ncbi:MAG: METTL5 family protein [Nanoarchaeota archaeon]|nr:METTL5 family protein [Nanoarchaeota archaeon]MBU1631857.1 METTL5 family protein [Nanoarchaeota archaeon]MBU1875850.1 METTL5 family protein [Nanoarchaeota archaeon]
MSIRSKRDLEVVLSRLKSFEKPSLQLEQYATPSNIAAEWVWNMAMKGEVAGKIILDAASGPGIIGIGLLLMGAKKIYFIDKDQEAIMICMENYQNIKKEYEIGAAEFIIEDISLFDAEVDIVVQNPPFGTKDEHADKKFLEKAFEVSKIVYSMHKWTTKKFVEAITRDFNFKITDLWRYEFPIKAAFEFHQKPVKVIDVGLWKLEKI